MSIRLPGWEHRVREVKAVNDLMTPPVRILSGTVRSTHPILGRRGGFHITPSDEPWEPPPNCFWLAELGEVFDLSRFAVARTPLTVRELRVAVDQLPALFVIWTMAIKMPGTDYRLPAELEMLRPLIQQCADVEAAVNPNIGDYYVYLTVDRSHVVPGERQRANGAHSDGIQGRSVQPKQPADHTYIWTDMAPPRFYDHPFDLSGLSPDEDWLDSHFAEQANPVLAETFGTETLILADSYCVHEAVPTSDEGIRTFVRVNVSRLKYDRQGNTRNKMFSYRGWRFQPRPAPSGLRGGPQ